MTIKEKLALITKTRQENARRMKAWLEERKTDGHQRCEDQAPYVSKNDDADQPCKSGRRKQGNGKQDPFKRFLPS